MSGPAAGAHRSDFAHDLLLVPNLISLGRIAGVLAAAGCLFLGLLYAALAIGLVTGFTDYFDGYLARKLNQVTRVGALLDSLADILAALVCITVAVDRGLWPAYLLIVWGIRDIGVLALRASAAQQGFTIPTSMLGKVAMNFTGYAYILIAFDLVRPFGQRGAIPDGIHWFAFGAIHVGLALQWVAGWSYVRSYAGQYRREQPAGPG